MNQKSQDIGAVLVRLLLSFLFLYSGVGKLLAPEATQAYIANAGIPLPALSYAAALCVELGVALAFLLGYQTRITAFVLAVFTLASAFMFHAHFGDKMQLIQFLKNLAICGGLLQVFLSSPGTLLSRQSAARQ